VDGEHRERQADRGKQDKVARDLKRLSASAMTLPQLGMLGGVPVPMNDRIASAIIADAHT